MRSCHPRLALLWRCWCRRWLGRRRRRARCLHTIMERFGASEWFLLDGHCSGRWLLWYDAFSGHFPHLPRGVEGIYFRKTFVLLYANDFARRARPKLRSSGAIFTPSAADVRFDSLYAESDDEREKEAFYFWFLWTFPILVIVEFLLESLDQDQKLSNQRLRTGITAKRSGLIAESFNHRVQLVLGPARRKHQSWIGIVLSVIGTNQHCEVQIGHLERSYQAEDQGSRLKKKIGKSV